MSRQKEIVEFSKLMARYACAILAMFVASYVVAVLALKALSLELMPFLSGFYTLHWKACTGTACLVALAGMLAGSLCVSNRNRPSACITLMVLGLACYQTFWWVYWRHEIANTKHGNYSLLPGLAMGGLFALAITWNGVKRVRK
jgi:hypothetical protein